MMNCPTCGKLVPSANLALHQYSGRCHAGMSTTLGTSEDQAIPILDEPLSSSASPSNPIDATSVRQHQGDDEVVCLVNDDEDDENEEVQEEWSCSRCTLLNSIHNNRCDACGGCRPSNIHPADENLDALNTNSNTRSPDPVIHDRLVQNPLMAEANPRPGDQRTIDSVFQRSIGGGALLGGLIGGTSAFMRGESISGGTINGMITGGVSGVIAAELARELAGAAHGTSQHNGVERRQRSQRIYLRRLADGSVQIINNNGQHSNPMTEMMLRSMFAPGALGVRGGDIDNMSYEQILEMFGDGSENRGADEGTIRRLPTSTLTNVSDLPEEQKNCTICLEEFVKNDKVRRLPCLHYFHEGCVDRWLRNNASCPVCKHSIK